ncbi:MAG: AAA family ATPase [Patescibacteria group bacterium]
MVRIVAVVNQKGGVGKTTTVINTLAYLASQGKKVLMIDIDPQANATSGIGINPREVRGGIYGLITNQLSALEVIVPTGHDNFEIIPSSVDLAGGAIDLVSVEGREFRLSSALESVKDNYDYIFIDCPPALNLLTVNSLVAASEVLIPIQAEYYALEGLGQLLNTVELVKQGLNPSLEVLGAVITMYTQNQRLAREVWLELYKNFPGRVFRSTIPRNVKLAEAPGFQQHIFQYSGESKGAKAYERLGREILETEKSHAESFNSILNQIRHE